MSILPSTSTALPSKPQPRRESRFTEGSLDTQADPSTSPFLHDILTQMDALEAARVRRHRNSNSSHSSVDSFAQSHASVSPTSPTKPMNMEQTLQPKEPRRSATFGRPSADFTNSRMSLEERPKVMEKAANTFKGRLRALTGGRNGDMKTLPYPGT